MRDLINLIQHLEESEGLANRKPGAVFRNSAGDEITFNEVNFYPSKGGEFDPEQLEKELLKINKLYPNIGWENNKSARTRGFGIASFTNADGELIYVGQYFNKIKPSKKDNYMPNKFGDYSFSSKSSEKSQSGMSPQDLLTTRTDLTPDAILAQLASSLGTNNEFYKVAVKVAKGSKFPIKFTPPAGASFTGFRDYFCEILQPMALMSGMYSGNAGEAAEIFLDGSFNNAKISFGDSKTEGLSDSILMKPNGKFIKVSSKGGKGAQASVKNLIDSVNELQGTKNGRQLLNQYKDVIDLLKDVQQQGQNNAPLVLGVKFKIIDEQDAAKVKSLNNLAPINMKNLSKLKLSKKLTSLAQDRKTKTPDETNIYFHLMAAIAHEVAEKVNNETNFSEAAADILNNGALVQVYTIAKESKTEWELRDFETVYPGKSIKGVYFSASKNYYSTRIKGNFTFMIDKGEGEIKEPNEDPVIVDPTPAPEIDLAKTSRAIRTKKILPSPVRTIAKPDVGREKRKK